MAVWTNILDDFNRANGGLGANWTSPLYLGDPAPVISGNVVIQNGVFSDAYWNQATYGPDCEAFATMATLPAAADFFYLSLRVASPGTASLDGYHLRVLGNGDFQLFRIDNGADTQLGATVNRTIAAGDRIGIEAVGSDIRAYHYSGGSWTLVMTRTDATYNAAGNIALGLSSGGSLDDFGGQTVAGSQSVSPTFIAETSQVFAPTLGFPANNASPFTLAQSALAGPHALAGAGNPSGPQSVSPSFVAGNSQVFVPTLQTGGGAQSIAPSFITSTAQVFTPTLQPGTVSVAPSFISSSAQVFTPTLQASIAVSPGFIGSNTQVFTPVIAHRQSLGVVFTNPIGASNNLRFYGNTSSSQDKARIELDSPANPPIDVGASDFTYEFWMKARYADNTSASIADARFSNIILDRDIWGHARGWVLGVTRRTGPILAVCWAVADTGGGWATVYGSTDVGDDAWHHVALTWRQSTRVLEVYVDGVSQGTLTISETNLSYPDGERPGSGANNEYLVIGGEKHGVGVAYSGLFDELRVSNVRRYTAGFTRPSAPFGMDSATVGLFHFNEGTGTTVYDATGLTGAENAELLVGGSPQGPVWALSTAPLGTQVFSPTLQFGQSVSPSFISPSSQVFTPTLQPGAVSIQPGFIASSAQVFTPALQASIGVAPAFIAPATQVFAPTLQASIAVSPSFIAATSQVFALTLQLGAVSVAPNFIPASTTVFDPALSQGSGSTQSIAPSFIPASAMVFAPTLQVGAVSVAPAFIAPVAQVFAPTIQVGSVTITLPLIPASTQVFAPTLSDGASQSITPIFIPGQSMVFAPALFFVPGYPMLAEVNASRVVCEVPTRTVEAGVVVARVGV